MSWKRSSKSLIFVPIVALVYGLVGTGINGIFGEDVPCYVFIFSGICAIGFMHPIVVLLYRVSVSDQAISAGVFFGKTMVFGKSIRFSDIRHSRIEMYRLPLHQLRIELATRWPLRIPLHLLSETDEAWLTSLPQLKLDPGLTTLPGPIFSRRRVIGMLGAVIVCSVSFILYARYLLDDSDLVSVAIRAERLGVHRWASQAGVGETVRMHAFRALVRKIKALKGFDLLENVSVASLLVDAQGSVPKDERLHTYRQMMEQNRAIMGAWDESVCSQLEASVDALSDQEMLSDHEYWMAQRVLDIFLRARFLMADPSHVSRCSWRYVQSLRLADERTKLAAASWRFQALSMRAHELMDYRTDIATFVQKVAEDIPNVLSHDIALNFEIAYSEAQVPGVTSLEELTSWGGEPWERRFVMAAGEVRHWRSAVLNHYLDDFEGLKDYASYVFMAAHPQAFHGGYMTMQLKARNDVAMEYYARQAVVPILFARSLAADLRHETQPDDPFAPAGTPLRTKILNGWRISYSIGPNGVDDGCDRKKDMLISAQLLPTTTASGP